MPAIHLYLLHRPKHPPRNGPLVRGRHRRSRACDFVHDAGPIDGTYFMPQIMGSGGALFDFDNDGRLDIYLVQNGGPKGDRNRLYRQQADGTFEDVSAGSGLDVAGYGMGVAIGDVNNDGLPDVYLTGYGGVRLFLNQGGGSFRDVTKEAGLDNPALGHLGRLLRLRPRRLARPRRRQLRQHRPRSAVHQRRRGSATTVSRSLSRDVTPAVPQPRLRRHGQVAGLRGS